jgi:hypothetical protein
MPAEPPPEPSVQSPLPVPAREPRAAAEARALAEAERRINSPSPLTLRLLGVVCLATLLPWLAAKVACNDRESPVRQPHDLATDVLAKTPKGAALELSQRAASGRFREAAELGRGDVARELLDADARCQSEPAPCEKLRAQAERVFTRAVVASRGPFEATARTESRVADGAPERFAMRLAQTDGRWYVVSRTPLAGEIDAPVLPEEQVSPVAVRPSSGPHGNLSSVPPMLAPQEPAPTSGAPGQSPSP